MKTAVGVVLGLFGGVLLNLVIGAILVALTGPGSDSSDSLITALALVWAVFLCIACTAALLVRAASTLLVVRRGSIMGIVLWALMIPLGPIVVARYVAGDRDLAATGSFLSSFVVGGAVFMVLVCVGCLVATHLALKKATSPMLGRAARPTA